MKEPVIGILSGRETGGVLPRYVTTGHYIEQIQRAGGVPVQLPLTPAAGPAQLDAWVRLCAGLLLPGGGDLDPAFYGQAPLPGPAFYGELTAEDRRAQENELDLIRRAAEAGLPMLGICLGCQALNVAFGGTLIQDIPTQVPGALQHHQEASARTVVTHRVRLVPGTLTARLSGAEEVQVNTYHHQAVDRPAPGFVAAGHAPDGVIEAIEAPERQMLGLQWHPENLAAAHEEAFALFRWLVDCARGRNGGRP